MVRQVGTKSGHIHHTYWHRCIDRMLKLEINPVRMKPLKTCFVASSKMLSGSLDVKYPMLLRLVFDNIGVCRYLNFASRKLLQCLSVQRK
ncbi:hypothetical protein V6N13_047497 [Hibiscus sabdariffa]|uniref:Uncharacterized protein n=1 Tax=Hibiscus sabdariffa TaxID=183260 RepID=A0ABR2F4C3_9ROSI